MARIEFWPNLDICEDGLISLGELANRVIVACTAEGIHVRRINTKLFKGAEIVANDPTAGALTAVRDQFVKRLTILGKYGALRIAPIGRTVVGDGKKDGGFKCCGLAFGAGDAGRASLENVAVALLETGTVHEHIFIINRLVLGDIVVAERMAMLGIRFRLCNGDTTADE